MKIPGITINPVLEVFQDKRDEWRWTIQVGGKIIGSSSEGYKNKVDCIKNLLNVRDRINQLEKLSQIK